MPAKIQKLPNGKYQVRTPNGIHAKGTSKKKAESQARLLNAVDHGWKPGNTEYLATMKTDQPTTFHEIVGTSNSQVTESLVNIGNKIPKGY